MKEAFNNKSPSYPFKAVCVKSVTRGNVVSDIWNLRCDNFDERNDQKVQKWPFNVARNGNSEIKISMQRKKGRSVERNCKKALHKKYRNQKGVIKCEPQQSKPACRCQQYTDRWEFFRSQLVGKIAYYIGQGFSGRRRPAILDLWVPRFSPNIQVFRQHKFSPTLKQPKIVLKDFSIRVGTSIQ